MSMKTTLIAPCGLNCRLCGAYTRDKNVCNGCNSDHTEKLQYCSKCKIRNCIHLSKKSVRFCFSCNQFPCSRIKNLDKRYKGRYGLSVIHNLKDIEKFGIRQFVRNEKEKWKCPICKEILCMHKSNCVSCGYERKI